MEEEIVGLIPAAGKGTRLNLPYPKELYPIIRNNHYKPLAQFVVENMIESGVKDIVFVINETKHQLIGYFGNGSRFGCNISYVVQENNSSVNGSTSPGLANALDSAYHLVKEKTVFFGMADTLMEPKDLFRCIMDRSHRDEQVLLGLFSVKRPEKFGMVDMENDGRVNRIVDKPNKTLLKHAWGCIVWRPAFTEFLHNKVYRSGASDFAKIMNEAIASDMVFRGILLPQGQYADMGTYDEIEELEKKHRSR